MEVKRGQWTSRLGFIVAAAGSAIGLGNIWKFPGKVGAGGGGAYVIVYILIVFSIGMSVMLAELVVGRHTQRNTVGAFQKINRKWAFVGVIGLVCGFIVLSYYSVIGGYVLKYVFTYLTGARFGAGAGSYFDSFVSNPWQPLLWNWLFLGLTAFIVLKGIAGGIERANKLLMPALFVLLILVMIHSLLMPGATEGVRFLTTLDFSHMNAQSWLSALGQALFSLSIGLGTTCTYGSYLKKDENLASSTATICLLDTLIAIIAAYAVIPAVFATNTELGMGGAFAFVALPGVFDKMSGGVIYGVLFYLLLSFAALTSSISLLEGAVAYVVEQRGVPRRRAVWWIVGAMALVGAIYSLSQGALPLKGIWYTVRSGVIYPSLGQMMELVTDYLLIPLGSLGFCIFVGWIWGAGNAVEEITQHGRFRFYLQKVWMVFVKYLAPASIVLIIVMGMIGVIKI